jgi:hypothetical protein
MVALVLRADHVASAFEEVRLFTNLAAQAFLYAALAWAMYLALEPVARRRWPHLLVGWTRLLSGRTRDPLVGRDVLVGTVAGIALALVLHLGVAAPAWLGLAPSPPRGTVLSTLASARHLLHFMLWHPYAGVSVALGALLGLVMFQAVLRRRALAVGVLALALYFGFPLLIGADGVWSPATAAFTVLFLAVVLRAGMLSAAVAIYTMLVIESTPFAADPGAWHADRMWMTLVLVAALLAVGFHAALGGKPMFGSAWVDRD